jgi:YD repeat-containing protein
MGFFNKLRWACLICLFIGTNYSGFSQVSMGSPVDPSLSSDAAVPGMGGLYNINLFTGVATINIPIYSHPDGSGADFGVSLSYNTKGVKAEQLSSEVGLNWQLNAGGSIVRVLKDLPDELYAPDFMGGDPAGWPRGYADFQEMRGRWAASFESPTEAARTDVYRDKESDDFIVSAGSLQFTFNIGKTGEIFTHPNKRVKIELLNGGNPVSNWLSFPANPSNLGFRIRDEHGDTYYFVVGEQSLMTINSIYRTDMDQRLILDYLLTSRWVLEKIVFRNSSVIQYNYIGVNQELTNPSSTSIEGYITGIVISESRTEHNSMAQLSSITFPNNVKVELEYASGRCDMDGKRLNRVKVSSGPNNCMWYRLHQSYFVADYPNNSTYGMQLTSPCNTFSYLDGNSDPIVDPELIYRLKLDSISIENCNGTYAEPYYSFNYSDTPLGIRGDGSDYFGYYNGMLATTGSYIPTGFSPHIGVPHHYSTGYGYGLDKSPNPFHMVAGILTKVKNASGGAVEFEYSGSTVSSITSPLESHLTLPTDTDFMGATAIDGLRITRIKETDVHYPSNNRTHEYQYTNGQRYLVGGYFSYPLWFESQTSNIVTSKSWASSFISAHQPVQGSNQGYSNVKVTAIVGGDVSKYTEYVFTNLVDETSLLPRYQRVGSGSKHYFEFPFTHKQYLRDWEIGLPLSVKEYDHEHRPILEKTYTYQFSIDSTTSATKQVENEKVMYCDYEGANFIALDWGLFEIDVREMRSFSDIYRPFTGKAQLISVASKNYVADNAYTEETVNYSYDGRNNLVGTSTWDSDGSALYFKKIYNYNVLLPSPGSDLYHMNEDGIECQVGYEQWLQQSSGNILLDANINTFGYQNGVFYPKGLYALRVEDPVSACNYAGHCGSPPYPVFSYGNINAAFGGTNINYFKKISEATIVDNRGNPLESQSLGQDIYKSTIWDTIHGFKLAEVANARYTDIAYNGFEVNPVQQPSVIVNQGNFSYFITQVNTSQSFTGRSSCLLMNSFQYQTITGVQDLSAGKEYLLSFWALGDNPLLYIGTVQISLPAPVKEQNGWKHYIVRFTPASASKIKFQSPIANMVYVDEIRLHPVVSAMQSWTHEPMFGVSSATDVSGRVERYEYDELGREILTRDEDGYIRKKVEQSVRGYN